MTEYRLAKKTVSYGKTSQHGGPHTWKTVDIPDDARFVDVTYVEPTGMGKPSLKAKIRYLVPVDDAR
jgi:hypothetical protein